MFDNAKALAQVKKAEKYRTLDLPMNQVYSWSKSKTPVRIALWNHFMDKDDQSTAKTAQALEPWINMKDSDVRKKAAILLKK